jgi:ABC-type multidrug transport system permease subunit
MITPVLYLVAFGWGLGRSVAISQGNYLDFVLPGIMALNSMNISFNAVGTPMNMSRLYNKTLEEYLTAPIGSVAIVTGKILSGVLRGLISSAMIVVLAYLFGASFTVNIWFFLALVLNCAVFAALAVVAAMIMDSHEEMANFNTYVLLPMSFLCATFFLPERLPVLARWAVEILPLTHASYALRSIGNGGEFPAVSLLVMALYVLIFAGIGVWKLRTVRD